MTLAFLLAAAVTLGPPLDTVASRCELVEAMVQASGFDQMGKRRYELPPLVDIARSGARVDGRVVVRVVWLEGTERRPFFEAGETCPQKTFVFLHHLAPGQTPINAHRLDVIRPRRKSRYDRLEFKIERIQLDAPPPGMHHVRFLPVTLGRAEYREGRWSGTLYDTGR